GLAKLHQCTANDFGLDHTNFIGSLQQQNERKTTWTDFLLTQRFEPMLKMAMDSGHISSSELAQFSKFERHAVDIWPEEPPALLHGDLWSGNYLPAENDEPCIIDPAVYYGHREIDIGMMHLFGGFSNELFEAYNEVFPMEKNWQDRIPYNQLYPLLVHVNLFGRSYWSGVSRTISAF
ncbi:fructosamine kinase family protein, partial [Crocinitomix catalasitica]|nr:fructosamine kinase family protein [Crocinitomix catalasitica]